jgi:hypothetical protein
MIEVVDTASSKKINLMKSHYLYLFKQKLELVSSFTYFIVLITKEL